MRLKDEAQRRADSSPSAFHETFGSLDGCMLNGDPEQNNRERHIRRWSLGISVSLQTVLIIAMVMAPLFAKTDQISYVVTPFPPYAGQPKSPQNPAPRHAQPVRPAHTISFFRGIPPTIVPHTSPSDDTSNVASVFGPSRPGPGMGAG